MGLIRAKFSPASASYNYFLIKPWPPQSTTKYYAIKSYSEIEVLAYRFPGWALGEGGIKRSASRKGPFSLGGNIRNVYLDCWFLGCGTAESGTWLPTFQTNLMPTPKLSPLWTSQITYSECMLSWNFTSVVRGQYKLNNRRLWLEARNLTVTVYLL
jgi:hypothetical protein